jgi:hypothetical protein
MDIEISRVSYEKVSLTDKQVREITLKYLKTLLQPGEFISPDGNRLMSEDEYRHGSPSYSDVGAASAMQNTAYDMIMFMNDAEKERQKLEDGLAKMKQSIGRQVRNAN